MTIRLQRAHGLVQAAAIEKEVEAKESLAGAGVHPGRVYGETDELGYSIVSGKTGVHDLQATILHLAGLDPETLSYPYQGLDQRLIGPAHGPRVMTDWFA